MRTIKELLQLVLERIDLLSTGLCEVVCTLHHEKDLITHDEFLCLINFINKNAAPKPYMLRYYCDMGVFKRKSQICSFYWPIGKVVPRKKWLKKQISKL